MSDMFGIPVVVSDLLPMPPSHREEARRIVRHGFGAEFLAWCGAGDVGPKPGDLTHVLLVGGTIYASAAIVGRIRETAA